MRDKWDTSEGKNEKMNKRSSKILKEKEKRK